MRTLEVFLADAMPVSSTAQRAASARIPAASVPLATPCARTARHACSTNVQSRLRSGANCLRVECSGHGICETCITLHGCFPS